MSRNPPKPSPGELPINVLSLGRIADWKDEKGYGFILPMDGGDRVFVHISSFCQGSRRPAGGEIVRYHAERDEKGRLRAASVEYVSAENRRPVRSPVGWPTAATIFLLMAALLAVVAMRRLPLAVIGIYGFVSLITYAAYASDKAAAHQGERRTPESTLHLLGLLCGWPGALLAQRRLRHKSQKPAFQFTFYCTVFANIAALAFFATPFGAGLIKGWIS